MANAKRDSQERAKSSASAKLSKEMKADIEKMMDKRLSSIEKQLEKLQGNDSKGSNLKGSRSKGKGSKTSEKTKAKQDNSAKGKKTSGRSKKKSNQRNEEAE